MNADSEEDIRVAKAAAHLREARQALFESQFIPAMDGIPTFSSHSVTQGSDTTTTKKRRRSDDKDGEDNDQDEEDTDQDEEDTDQDEEDIVQPESTAPPRPSSLLPASPTFADTTPGTSSTLVEELPSTLDEELSLALGELPSSTPDERLSSTSDEPEPKAVARRPRSGRGRDDVALRITLLHFNERRAEAAEARARKVLVIEEEHRDMQLLPSLFEFEQFESEEDDEDDDTGEDEDDEDLLSSFFKDDAQADSQEQQASFPGLRQIVYTTADWNALGAEMPEEVAGLPTGAYGEWEGEDEVFHPEPEEIITAEPSFPEGHAAEHSMSFSSQGANSDLFTCSETNTFPPFESASEVYQMMSSTDATPDFLLKPEGDEGDAWGQRSGFGSVLFGDGSFDTYPEMAVAY